MATTCCSADSRAASRSRRRASPRAAARGGGRGGAAVVVADARPAPMRTETRAALRRARLAEWREGVWLRPDNIDLDESPHCEWLDARPDADPVALAARLFAPARWRTGADRLVAELQATTGRLAADPEGALAPAFLAGAAAVRHVRARSAPPRRARPVAVAG